MTTQVPIYCVQLDFNLLGMGMLRAAKVLFREPLPTHGSPVSALQTWLESGIPGAESACGTDGHSRMEVAFDGG